jgi:CRISPR/Cas system CSM-associated protein Csm2 small subunit
MLDVTEVKRTLKDLDEVLDRLMDYMEALDTALRISRKLGLNTEKIAVYRANKIREYYKLCEELYKLLSECIKKVGEFMD